MNTNITGFRWFDLVLWMKVTLALEGSNRYNAILFYVSKKRKGVLETKC